VAYSLNVPYPLTCFVWVWLFIVLGGIMSHKILQIQSILLLVKLRCHWS